IVGKSVRRIRYGDDRTSVPRGHGRVSVTSNSGCDDFIAHHAPDDKLSRNAHSTNPTARGTADGAFRLVRLEPISAFDQYNFFHYIDCMTATPMTGPAFLVLTALADGPRHGYGIVREVAELSENRVKLKIGSLYGLLDRLATDKLIELDREEPHNGRLGREYPP